MSLGSRPMFSLQTVFTQLKKHNLTRNNPLIIAIKLDCLAYGIMEKGKYLEQKKAMLLGLNGVAKTNIFKKEHFTFKIKLK